MSHASADRAAGASRPWARRVAARLQLVLIFHPGEFAEVVIGMVCFSAGAAMTLEEVASGTSTANLVGAYLITGLSAVQVLAALAGSVSWRYAASVAGCAAAVGHTTRAVHENAPLLSAVFGALSLACLLLWIRIHIQAFGPWKARGGACDGG